MNPQAQVYLQRHGQHQQNGSTLGQKIRVPTVHQALPFTPFTSIIPFDSSIVASPTCPIIKAQDVDVLDVNTLMTSRNILSNLSAGATRAEDASQRCQQTLKEVRRLLQSNNLTKFKFRKPVDRRNGAGNETNTVEPLSNFAKMVFDAFPVQVEYASGDQNNQRAKPNFDSAPQPMRKTNGDHTGISAKPAQHHMPMTTPNQVAYQSDASTFVTTTDVPPVITPRTTQHPVVRLHSGLHATVSVDQKAKGQASVQVLAALLNEIFYAEDAILEDEVLSNDILSIFRFQDVEEGASYLLAPAYQTRLENAIAKAASAFRLESIPTEDLKRVQKMCDGIVQISAETSLQPRDNWSESNIEEWEQHLNSAEASLLAIRTLLKIMTAASTNRELQSEDLVRSILKAMRNIAESGVVAVVETHGEKKNAEATNTRFALAVEHHDQLLLVLRGFTKALRSLGALLTKVNVDESAISSIVYMCKILIFAENASNDRESVLGVQTYEGSRRHAMDVLAKVFDKYAEHRQFIFDEILVSLEKLPATKQSARQFRLPDAKPIQLVSALIMQLIQTSATRGGIGMTISEGKQHLEETDSDEDSEDESEDDLAKTSTPKKEQSKDLQILITPLDQATQGSALYVTKTLIQRALNTAKNADEPHRKLLDIFTEDFITVLSLPEWPSAELLLRSLLRQMLGIIDNKKSSAPARNFALESLGRMGTGILELQSHAQNHAKSVAAAESVNANKMSNILQQIIDGNAPTDELLHLEGPYRTVLECLQGKRNDETHIHTAIGYHLLQWAHEVCTSRASSVESDTSDKASKTMQSRLRAMIIDPQWFETNVAFENITPAEGRLAAMLITTSSPFCRAFQKIFSVLLTNMTSEQSTVKSKALRSVVTLIETDPAVLDRNTYVLRSILRCAEDSSSLVRDAALGLIARCMVLRPQLDGKILDHIVLRLSDTAIGVRKRAMKMLKDIYLRNEIAAIRSAIATAIVGRMKDTEESVTELAKHTMEEIWFQPLYTSSLRNEGDVATKIIYRSQAALLVQAVELSDEMPEALASLLRELLRESKSSKDNTAVSKRIVEVLFEGIIDGTDFSASITQGMLLQALAVFAQAAPKLLTAAQLELLEPYTRNLMTNEDLTIFRLALNILRHAMPHAIGLKKNFLSELQKALLGTLGKLPNSEFPEVAVCLWAIDGELQSTEILVRVVCSAVTTMRSLAGKNISDAATSNKLTRLMSLAGQFGKACDLEPHVTKVKSSITGTKSDSVAGIIVESLALFGHSELPLPIRQAALRSICAVCQRWPKQFLRPDVSALFKTLLHDKDSTLEVVFLEGLLEFFSGLEGATSNASDPEAGATGRERLAKTYVATEEDGAATSLSQQYLQHMLGLATSSVDDAALTATKLVASIVRQGLPHPKVCGPALIALETSPNSAIAQLACAEHRTLHEKHESIIEKEYMRSMDRALLYQQQVVGDNKGWTGQPPTSKLHFFWEVLRGGKAKVRQKFLINVCSKMAFEPSALELPQDSPTPHLSFVRFMTENVALFDFDKTEDVKLLIENLGKAFSTTGTALAQSIDSEVFNMTVESIESSQPAMQEAPIRSPVAPSIQSSRLNTLAVSAQILLLIAEARAFLVRIWGGPKLMKKDKAKETLKAPARVSNAATLAESFVKRMEQLMQPCVDQASQTTMCRTFAEVVSTDNEVKVGSDDDEDGFDEDVSENRDLRSPSAALTGTPPGRKRKSVSLGATGSRKRGRPRKTPSFIRVDEDDDAEGEWE